jgi:PLP dependent protein
MNRPSLDSRLERVRERVASACLRSGRSAEEVTLVAVTKGHPPEVVRAILAAGLADVGENRVQELDAKVEAVGRDSARWHLIGHLQRNKVRRALDLADLIHSVDSLRLARKLSDEAVLANRTVEMLVQVNVSGEATKGGVERGDALAGIEQICALPGLRVLGLMTMAPFVDDERVLRSVFAKARELRDAAAAAVPGFRAGHLSMGMSADFEIAIEEGSTIVRLGTVLFGEREQEGRQA